MIDNEYSVSIDGLQRYIDYLSWYSFIGLYVKKGKQMFRQKKKVGRQGDVAYAQKGAKHITIKRKTKTKI